VTELAGTGAGSARRISAYLACGIAFGIVLTKSEVTSWYRIQEMFRFQSFHMYGVIASAVATAALGVRFVRWMGARSMDGTRIDIPHKSLGRGTRYWLGGAVFGVGWALVGACPGPLFALVGSGVSVMIVPLASALVGTWIYGVARPHLPH
jgi:uncharacterized membrane protein YedE/YeeE